MATNRIYAQAARKPTEDIVELQSSTDPGVIEKYLMDESSAYKGAAEGIFFPQTEEHISIILKQANQSGSPVTISGGGTSITGSRVPFGGIILTTEKLTAVTSHELTGSEDLVEEEISGQKYSLVLNRQALYVIAPAGISIADFSSILDHHGFAYPPDPTEPTALLGGTVATNASGARSFHYGATRDWVRRLRVVLVNGDVLDIKRGEIIAENNQFEVVLTSGEEITIDLPGYNMPAVKNAAGYFSKRDGDLIDLFIGCEGTLGVISEIEVQIIEQPKEVMSCLAYFPNEQNALNFVDEVRRRSGIENDLINALSIEYFDHNSLKLLRTNYANIPEGSEAAVFFEQIFEGEEILLEWAELLENHGSLDNWLGLDEKHQQRLKEFRHSLPETINSLVRTRGVHKLGTDMAVPEEAFDEMMKFYNEVATKSGVEYVIFGHIGDCHVHLNFLANSVAELTVAKQAYLELARKAVELGGTISAEHGVGKKTYQEDGKEEPYLKLMYGEAGLEAIAKTKSQLDPKGILNRGNVVAAGYLRRFEK